MFLAVTEAVHGMAVPYDLNEHLIEIKRKKEATGAVFPSQTIRKEWLWGYHHHWKKSFLPCQALQNLATWPHIRDVHGRIRSLKASSGTSGSFIQYKKFIDSLPSETYSIIHMYKHTHNLRFCYIVHMAPIFRSKQRGGMLGCISIAR